MIKYIFSVLLLVRLCIAAPADCGIRFDKRDGALPFLTLPYGTWQATKYDPNGDVSIDSVPILDLDVNYADPTRRYILSKTFATGRHRLGD